MTDEIRNDEVETSTDEVVNEIVEETLEEAEAMSSVKAKGSAKDASPVSEPESIASVDKAADAVKPKQAPAPKTKAGMISAMTDKMLKMSKSDMESMYASYHKMKKEEVEEMEGEAIVESPEVDTMGELNALVESEATLSDEFKEKNCSNI